MAELCCVCWRRLTLSDDPSVKRTAQTSKSENLRTPLEDVKTLITSEYGDELWVAIKTGIAIVTSLSIKGRPLPVTLIFEGASGRGKSTIINLLSPDRAQTKQFLYRLDKFTSKSFVTHAANVSKKEMEEIDLLPKLRDKVLLVKELAPLFRGRDQDLTDTFATLTSVLDGKGHLTASGVHGTRGYDERLVFNWIGATTPIPHRTDTIMAQLGNRLLRYEVVGAEQTEDELMEFADSYEPVDVEERCRAAINDYIASHFACHPVDSVDPKTVLIPEEHRRHLVRLGQLIAQGRVEITPSDGLGSDHGELTVGLPEGPHRVILYLRIIAQGLALACGRSQVESEDLEIIRHIAFSSLPSVRRKVLRAVLIEGGRLESTRAETILGVTRPTVRSWMDELAATGIVSLTKGTNSAPDYLTLAGAWNWLLPVRSELETVAYDGALEAELSR
jgi:hypothetical protein